MGDLFCAFGDESNWNKGRYRSIGLISLPKRYVKEIEEKIKLILKKEKLKEFKWKELNRSETKRAATKLLDLLVHYACLNVLRADVLIWDITDKRHDVLARDDTANLQFMYYKLLKNVLTQKWPDESEWILVFDEISGVDWNDVGYYLKKKEVTFDFEKNIFTQNNFSFRLKREFKISEIHSPNNCSVEFPIVQLADLMAGIAAFSYEYFTFFKRYKSKDTLSLFCDATDDDCKNIPRSKREKFEVLEYFDNLCKDKKLGVSLKEKKGLYTFNSKNPINFWFYTPQHPADKAPTKKFKIVKRL
ncbi:hypothetical protein [Carboxydothermus ferrireducens]|uniref:DUF3800 domain-containing protein n=1 Tax=Carboxydothermus ferrireducens DSM 11255 TaxID=1119529 RepID=A0ABX2R8E1_9THEO|nr:hypothetical protein [Carboxydothermus ferrireducens]NYE57189.1 hypothetical protein [Carboxydothermus ferrireducens DSM 11255]